jgi:hypothetical protein
MGLGGRGNSHKPRDPRLDPYLKQGLVGNDSGDRQVARSAFNEIGPFVSQEAQAKVQQLIDEADLPEEIRRGLNERVKGLSIGLQLPIGLNAAGKEVPYVLTERHPTPADAARAMMTRTETLEDGTRARIEPTPEQVDEFLALTAERAGSLDRATQLGLIAGKIGSSAYITRGENHLYAFDEARKAAEAGDPAAQRLIAEYIGVQPGTTVSVTPPGDAGWMAQRPGLLEKVPVLDKATNSQLAIGGAGIGGAGAAFLLDYLLGGDDREAQPVAVVPSGGMR